MVSVPSGIYLAKWSFMRVIYRYGKYCFIGIHFFPLVRSIGSFVRLAYLSFSALQPFPVGTFYSSGPFLRIGFFLFTHTASCHLHHKWTYVNVACYSEQWNIHMIWIELVWLLHSYAMHAINVLCAMAAVGVATKTKTTTTITTTDFSIVFTADGCWIESTCTR